MRSTFSRTLWATAVLLLATAPLWATDCQTCKPVNRSLLVVNCPPETSVTIDGRVTHSSGSMRQFDLSFAGPSHKCRVELRLRDNKKSVTYHFDHSLEVQPGKQAVLSVTRAQMEPVSDSDRENDITKLFKAGSTFKVNDDGKLELVDDPAKAKEDAAAHGQSPSGKTAASSAKANVVSPEQRTREQRKKQLAQDADAVKGLAKQESEKLGHWEAAVRLRVQLDDAYQLKLVEVDNAAKDSAAVQAAKRLEAKRLELDRSRAIEAERVARTQLDAAQHEHQIAKQRLSGTQRAVELIERSMIEKLFDKEIAAEQKIFDQLSAAAGKLSLDKDAATKAVQQAIIARVESETRSAIDRERDLSQKLTEAQRKVSESRTRLRQKIEELNGFRGGSIHRELP